MKLDLRRHLQNAAEAIEMTQDTQTSPSSMSRPQLMVQRAQLLEERSKSAEKDDAAEMLRIAANLRALAAMRGKQA